jgi:hypothetical protein
MIVKAPNRSFNKVHVHFISDSTLSASVVRPLPLSYHGGRSRMRAVVASGEAEDLQGICGALSSWRSTLAAHVWLSTQEAVGRLLQFMA